MTEFSWDDVYARRQILADNVQRELGLSFSFDVTEAFGANNIILSYQLLADQPMWLVPFYVVGLTIDNMLPHRVIDHGWWLKSKDNYHEPWGFVTEPYLDFDSAQTVVRLATPQIKPWGLTIKALPAEQSAWNPGSTVPIIVSVKVGFGSVLLRRGVTAALNQMREI